ncbi:NACHT domain-containing protein [Candidatus Methanocrinis alkalitolerans]|nr:NACHT domain-containing protein [Candidatus Methanocrinis alkalitolerans]
MIPISLRTLSRFITFSACLIFIIWGYSDYSNGIMPYPQAAGFLLALAAFLGSSRVSEKPVFKPSEKELAARDAHNRQAMLNRVRDFWVKGVLESSPHEEARIELGLEERRDAVAERPWDVILRTPDRPDCVLPPGTKISDVFERVGRSLLILGEPGAGKTTTLLELAREMIDRAGEDPSEKIPVVFNLSSWTDPKQPIADWLTEELRAKYNIPKKIAAPWVENDSFLLLLDGLDEVAPERRDACVVAINSYLDEHLVPVVVCCRKEEYDALDGRLNLQSAVLLQPLTPEQIDGYLERLSPDLNALREALQSDRELQQFAQTPLILSIMTLAYRGMPIEELQSLGSIEDRRRHLLKTYVDKMFKRDVPRTDSKLYPKDKMIHWLSWLARKMSEHNQTVFMIERMHPSWLDTKAQMRLYSMIIDLVGGLRFGANSGLWVGLIVGFWIVWLSFGPIVGLFVGIILGIIVGEIVTAILGLDDGEDREIELDEDRGNFGLIVGLIVGLFVGLSVGLSVRLSVGLSVGLFTGLIFAGVNVIEHFVLRLILCREDFLPWRLVPFLDYAAERIFLRKVGGGYVFVHRMLMEYFASLEPGPGGR